MPTAIYSRMWYVGALLQLRQFMKIEIWSDFVCPFCYIGKANLLQALQELNITDAEIVWRSFELDPSFPQENNTSHYQLLQDKYQLDLQAATDKCAQLANIGSSCGLEMNFAQAYYGNTFLAHQLQQLAQAKSAQMAAQINQALFHASFALGLPLNQVETLVELAAENGLDAEEVRSALNDKRYATAVRIDETAAQELNITAVPFFGFDGRLAVAGAQSIDAFKEVIQHILTHDAADDAKMLRQ